MRAFPWLHLSVTLRIAPASMPVATLAIALSNRSGDREADRRRGNCSGVIFISTFPFVCFEGVFDGEFEEERDGDFEGDFSSAIWPELGEDSREGGHEAATCLAAELERLEHLRTFR